MWNISIIVLIGLIGLISFVIMNFVSPQSAMDASVSEVSYSTMSRFEIFRKKSQLKDFELMTLDEFYKLLESVINTEKTMNSK